MALLQSFKNGVIWWPPPSPSPSSSSSSRFTVSCSSTQPQLSSLAINMNRTLKQIQNSGVIACLRADSKLHLCSAEKAIKAAHAAISGGISVLEIVMCTPGVFEVLQSLVQDHPTVTLGVGTVLNLEDAKKAADAGARFLMSPATVKDILYDLQMGEVLYIPGVMTPTEILAAHDAGAKIVKVYPVSALGGTNYIAALKKPFPHIPMVASQGINIDSIGDYIAKGATSVVLSDAIFNKEAIKKNEYNVVYQLACLAAVRCREAVERDEERNKRLKVLLEMHPQIALLQILLPSGVGLRCLMVLMSFDALQEKEINTNLTALHIARRFHCMVDHKI